MEQEILHLLRELEEFGESNDEEAEDRSQKMLNITHDTGVFLALLIKISGAQKILEIGTSNGYSTLWLAHTVGEQGLVTTIELDPHKIAMAEKNFEASGLQSRIQQIAGDAGSFFKTCQDGEFDFIFLDSNRSQYEEWWHSLQQIVKPGGLLVVDNAVSHQEQIADFAERVSLSKGYLTSLVPIGKGELVILKEIVN
ncbi:MAG: O-methyltransferase [SAR324 cluster bacterium]|nr:O-methyltransferase [SAR324 cluster bacterium]